MSRPYHGRRRRRPGRGRRYPGGQLPARPCSYQDFGFKMFYDLLIPRVRGRDRRRFFNTVSAGLAIWFGILGAVLGLANAGPFGAIIGWFVGIMIGVATYGRNGYYRP